METFSANIIMTVDPPITAIQETWESLIEELATRPGVEASVSLDQIQEDGDDQSKFYIALAFSVDSREEAIEKYADIESELQRVESQMSRFTLQEISELY